MGVWSEWGEASQGFHVSRVGANKFSYCWHKVFWDAVTGLISKGFTSDTAIDWIYLVYGQGKSIGRILKLMVQDR